VNLVPTPSGYSDAQKPKGSKVPCFWIIVSLALALRGIMGVCHGEVRGDLLNKSFENSTQRFVHVHRLGNTQTQKY